MKPCLGKSRYFTSPDRVSNARREDLHGCYPTKAFEKVFGRANFGHRMLGNSVSRHDEVSECVHAFACVYVYVDACVCARVRVCARVHARAWARVCLKIP